MNPAIVTVTWCYNKKYAGETEFGVGMEVQSQFA